MNDDTVQSYLNAGYIRSDTQADAEAHYNYPECASCGSKNTYYVGLRKRLDKVSVSVCRYCGYQEEF